MQLSGTSLPIEKKLALCFFLINENEMKVFEVTSLCTDTTTESVTPLFGRHIHDAPLNSVHVSNSQPAAAATPPQSTFRMHAHASCQTCDNP